MLFCAIHGHKLICIIIHWHLLSLGAPVSVSSSPSGCNPSPEGSADFAVLTAHAAYFHVVCDVLYNVRLEILRCCMLPCLA